MTEQNLIKLSDIEMVLDETNNEIYIDFKILNLKIEDVFKISKRLQSFFQKNIIFKFNGWYFEVNEETNIYQIKHSYKFQEQINEEIHYINYVNQVMQNATNKLEKSNIKTTIEELSKELLLDDRESVYKPYIRLCDQKQFTNKLYRIYRQNHNSERVELLLPTLEVPKVMLKNNRQFT